METTRLSPAMRNALWTLAQHKYGWGYESNLGNRLTVRRTMEALERRGLVALNDAEGVSGARYRPWRLLETARPLIAELWPVTPWGLGTYEHQPGGWSPREPRPGAQLPAVHNPKQSVGASLVGGMEGQGEDGQHG